MGRGIKRRGGKRRGEERKGKKVSSEEELRGQRLIIILIVIIIRCIILSLYGGRFLVAPRFLRDQKLFPRRHAAVAAGEGGDLPLGFMRNSECSRGS